MKSKKLIVFGVLAVAAIAGIAVACFYDTKYNDRLMVPDEDYDDDCFVDDPDMEQE